MGVPQHGAARSAGELPPLFGTEQRRQELRSVIDDQLHRDLGGRYDRHSTSSVGTHKLTVTLTLRGTGPITAST